MFGFLKNLLWSTRGQPAGTWKPSSFRTASAPVPVSAPPAASPPRLAPSSPGEGRQDGAPANRAHQNGNGLNLPLQNILAGFPLELQSRVRQTDLGGRSVSVPLEKILAQLSTGVVKISFGELRQAVPEIFSPESGCDRVMVTLPLADVLSRLNPALIVRQRVQRRVEVPADISSPFDLNGQGLVLSTGPSKAGAAPAPASTFARQTSPPPLEPITPVRHSIASFPSQSPPAAARSIPMPGVSMPPACSTYGFGPASPVGPPPAPAPRVSPAPSPATKNPPPAVHDFNGAACPPNGASVPEQPGSTDHQPPMVVALHPLVESWPEAVRKEIAGLNLVDAKLALPLSVIDQALRRGRIALSWKTLRSWIKPAVPPAASAQDGAVIELPLRIIAPLFLARQRETNNGRRKVAIDAAIPDLFFGFPQPEQSSHTVTTSAPPAPPAPPSSARPADTNYFSREDAMAAASQETPAPKRAPSPGTKFIAKYATPNEIVSKAAALEGVAGALIALPDGLMVASKLSCDLNSDTLAAFLPQIFGKVSQCTKELRMGELNNLNFTVGNTPWKIFRVNAIYFAAFGRAGEPLPTARLAALASELDHKPK
jgi:predicted regulator of Ras-like GTPase activity (Roadblock/LC7/MglB family)